MEAAFPDVPVAEIKKRYPASRYGHRADTPVWVAYRDRAVICPMNRMSKWAARGGIPAYQWFFGSNWHGGVFRATVDGVTERQDLPACYMPHGMELAQVFGVTPDASGGVSSVWLKGYHK